MAMFKRMCNGCYNTTYEDIQSYCPYCHKQYFEIKKLYTEIVKKRPHLRSASEAQLFTMLWKAFQKLENA